MLQPVIQDIPFCIVFLAAFENEHGSPVKYGVCADDVVLAVVGSSWDVLVPVLASVNAWPAATAAGRPR